MEGKIYHKILNIFHTKKTIRMNINMCIRVHFFYKIDEVDIKDIIVDCFPIIVLTYKLIFYHFGFRFWIVRVRLKCIGYGSVFGLTNFFVRFRSGFGLTLGRNFGFVSCTTRFVQNSKSNLAISKFFISRFFYISENKYSL